MIREEQLKELKIHPKWLEGLNLCFERFDISTSWRQAGFIGQCQHESANFTILQENLNYSADGLVNTWPKRFTKDTAIKYHRKPEAIANRVYADRMGNGDESSGDGWLYRGRGLIQLTGKQAYLLCGMSLDTDLVSTPERASEAPYAVLTAGWYWYNNNLNRFCDSTDWRGLTKAINGGYHGLDDRLAKISKALKVLGE